MKLRITPSDARGTDPIVQRFRHRSVFRCRTKRFIFFARSCHQRARTVYRRTLRASSFMITGHRCAGATHTFAYLMHQSSRGQNDGRGPSKRGRRRYFISEHRDHRPIAGPSDGAQRRRDKFPAGEDLSNPPTSGPSSARWFFHGRSVFS